MKIKKYNILLILGAFILAFAVFSFFGNQKDLLASVLFLREAEIIKKQQRDVAYKNTEDGFDIFLSSDIQDISSLHMNLLYENDYGTISRDVIQTQGNIDTYDSSDGILNLSFIGFESFNYMISLLEIPLAPEQLLVINNVFVIQSDGSQKYLHVGNLSEIDSHS